jgi:hypothetical protein
VGQTFRIKLGSAIHHVMRLLARFGLMYPRSPLVFSPILLRRAVRQRRLNVKEAGAKAIQSIQERAKSCQLNQSIRTITSGFSVTQDLRHQNTIVFLSA